MKYLSNDVNNTIKLGKRIGRLLGAGDLVGLVGNLGAGKTVFTKGLAEGIGVKNPKYVTSPSFVLIKEHKGKFPLYHFDLYRLDTDEEVRTTGYQDYFYGDGLTVIEWAQKIEPLLPKEYLRVEFKTKSENQREIKLIARGSKYKKVLSKLKV